MNKMILARGLLSLVSEEQLNFAGNFKQEAESMLIQSSFVTANSQQQNPSTVHLHELCIRNNM